MLEFLKPFIHYWPDSNDYIHGHFSLHHPPLYFLFLKLTYRIEISIIVQICMMICCCYLLSKLLTGYKYLPYLLLLIHPWIYIYSVSVLSEPLSWFLLTLFLYTLIHNQQEDVVGLLLCFTKFHYIPAVCILMYFYSPKAKRFYGGLIFLVLSWLIFMYFYAMLYQKATYHGVAMEMSKYHVFKNPLAAEIRFLLSNWNYAMLPFSTPRSLRFLYLAWLYFSYALSIYLAVFGKGYHQLFCRFYIIYLLGMGLFGNMEVTRYRLFPYLLAQIVGVDYCVSFFTAHGSWSNSFRRFGKKSKSQE